VEPSSTNGSGHRAPSPVLTSRHGLDTAGRSARLADHHARQHASYGPAWFAAANPNFAGGDIITGAKDVRQLVFGPRATLSP